MTRPEPPNNSAAAVVLLSGGLDSATTLAIARQQGFACHCLSFSYGQRHSIELDAARRVAASMHAAEHRVIDLDPRTFERSALTDAAVDVPRDRDEAAMAGAIPSTYVPARNLLFLSYATAWAESLDARNVFIGVNAVDYSGYPDCRPAFIDAFERAANLATKLGVEGVNDGSGGLRVHAPLIDLTKAQIVERGVSLGVDYGLTTSCYDPDARGRPCGRCDACRLRAAGFREAGIPDPALRSA